MSTPLMRLVALTLSVLFGCGYTYGQHAAGPHFRGISWTENGSYGSAMESASEAGTYGQPSFVDVGCAPAWIKFMLLGPGGAAAIVALSSPALGRNRLSAGERVGFGVLLFALLALSPNCVADIEFSPTPAPAAVTTTVPTTAAPPGPEPPAAPTPWVDPFK